MKTINDYTAQQKQQEEDQLNLLLNKGTKKEVEEFLSSYLRKNINFDEC